jgi:hypothetical protein
MCGEKLNDYTIGGLIKGDWVDFIKKNINEPGSPCIVWFCTECWLKMVEIRKKS